MATHSSILAWRSPWTEELGGLLSIGSVKSQTLKSAHAHTHARTHTHMRTVNHRANLTACQVITITQEVGRTKKACKL